MDREKPIIVHIEDRRGYIPSWVGFLIIAMLLTGFFWYVARSREQEPRPAVQQNP